MKFLNKMIAYMLVVAMVVCSITVYDKKVSADQSGAASYDWSTVSYLACDGTASAYTNRVKAVLASGTLDGAGIVNIQTSFATEPGIYITFVGADFGTVTINGVETSAYSAQGAGIIFHMSAFSQGANSLVVNNTAGAAKAEIYVYIEGETETTTTTTVAPDASGYTEVVDKWVTVSDAYAVYAGSWASGKIGYKGTTDSDFGVKIISSNNAAGSWGIQLARKNAMTEAGLVDGKTYKLAINYNSTSAGNIYVKLSDAYVATVAAVAGSNTAEIEFVYNTSLACGISDTSINSVGTILMELSGFPAGTELSNFSYTFTEVEGGSTPSVEFTPDTELLNRTDFGEGCQETDESDDYGLWFQDSQSGALYAYNGDGTATITVPAYNGTESYYDTQLKQNAITLVQGKWYRARYAITSDVDKTIQFLIQNNVTWAYYAQQDTIVKAGVTEYVDIVFQATETTTTAMYGFMMGPINGPCTAANVTFSEVSLKGYDTEEEARNYPRRVIDIISSATDAGVISMYWNVAGGNANAPASQVYDIEVDGTMTLTDVTLTAAELTDMSSGSHTITIYSKLGNQTTEGYTVTVVVPEPPVEKLGTIVNQVTELDKTASIGTGWTYNFPTTGADNFLGVDEYNSLVVYSPTANSEPEYIYKSITDLTPGKYYSYTYTIIGDTDGISVPVQESSAEGYLSEYTLTAGLTTHTYTNEILADDEVVTFRFDVRALEEAAVKISAITVKEILPVSADSFTATGNIENIDLAWKKGSGASNYQTYTITYTKDGSLPIQAVTGISVMSTSYTIKGLSEGKYVVTITSSINGKEVSVSSTTVAIGAAIKSNDISVEGFQIRTNDTSDSVAYRAICKVPNVGSTVTDEDGNVYTVKEFGTIYTIDTNWSGYNKDNKLSEVYTVLDKDSRSGQTYVGANLYNGANHTLAYVSTSVSVLSGWNNDDTANTYYVQTMQNMDPQIAFSLHVRAFAVAEDGTIIYGDSTAVTSVAQIADYFYNNSMTKNYTAHRYLYTSILNSKYLTATGITEANPGAQTGSDNNRYYRISELTYGWNGNLYNPSVIPVASAWKYRMSASSIIASNWNTLGFDDSAWNTGYAPFGDVEIGNIKYNTLWEDSYIWMRRTFELKDATTYANHNIVLSTWSQQGESIVDRDFEDATVGEGTPEGFEAVAVDNGGAVAVVEEDGNKFLRLTTGSASGHVNMNLPYNGEITANANQRIVVEFSARFNEELRYANAFMAKNQSGASATTIAFNNTDGAHKVILKKSSSSSINAADFSYDTWHHYKAVLNMQTQTYTVYMDGEVIAEDYTFRTTGSTALIGHAFGIDGFSNGQLDFDNFKVSVDEVNTPKVYLNGQLIYEIDSKDEKYTTVNLGTEFSKYLVDGTNVVAIEASNLNGGALIDCGMTLVKDE